MRPRSVLMPSSPLDLGSNQVEYIGPIGRRDESRQRSADHSLRMGFNQLREAPVAVKNVAAAGQGQCAFLHFLDQQPVGLIRSLERVNPRYVVRTRNYYRVHVSVADGIERLLSLPQLLSKGIILQAQKLLRVRVGSGTRKISTGNARFHLAMAAVFLGLKPRPARTRSSLARSPMIRRSGSGSILTKVGAAMIWYSFAAAADAGRYRPLRGSYSPCSRSSHTAARLAIALDERDVVPVMKRRNT